MKVRAVFAHPVAGILDVTTNVESIEVFKEELEKHKCSILFVEEVED